MFILAFLLKKIMGRFFYVLHKKSQNYPSLITHTDSHGHKNKDFQIAAMQPCSMRVQQKLNMHVFFFC